MSVSNRTQADPRSTLWLDRVPQPELQRLADALARGPLDGHFLLGLQGTMGGRPLGEAMAEGLVQDVLQRHLPATMAAAERQAWQQVLASLLVCSRAAWEVACAPLRGQLSACGADALHGLRHVRDALYRPHDLSSADWNAALLTARTRGIADARVTALAHQDRSRGSEAASQWLYRALQRLLPTLPDARLRAAVERVVSSSHGDAGLLNPRVALDMAFEAVADAGTPWLDDRTRQTVLAALGELEHPGSGGRGSALLTARDTAGGRIARQLQAVVGRAEALPRPGLDLPALLLTLCGVSAGLREAVPGWRPPLASRTGAAAALGPLAATDRPAATAVFPTCTSAASRRADSLLLSAASGLVGAGLWMIHEGWQRLTATPTAPTPPMTAHGPEPRATQEAVTFLDHVLDPRREATVWQDIRARVQNSDPANDGPLRADVADLLEAADVARRVLLMPPAATGSTVHEPVAGGHGRHRRAAAPEHDLARPAAVLLRETADRSALEEASLQLIEAARKAEPRSPSLSAVSFQPADGLGRAELSGLISLWQALAGQSFDSRAELARLLCSLSDTQVQRAHWHAGLPQLDDYLATELKRAFNASDETLDPGHIFRNTFARVQTWEDWTAGHRPPPSFRTRTTGAAAGAQRQGWVRSELVSSYSMVEASLLPTVGDDNSTAFYHTRGNSAFFPNQEYTALSLAQFNAAVRDRRFFAEFAARHERHVADVGNPTGQQARARFADTVSTQLASTGELLLAAGRLSARANWLLGTVLRYPAQFDRVDPARGRALVLPVLTLDVHPVQVPSAAGPIPLHGMALAVEVGEGGAVVLVCFSRTPMVEQFDTPALALAQVSRELPMHLQRWVAMSHHGQLRGNETAQLGTAYAGDFVEALYDQELSLRNRQLQHLLQSSPGTARERFLAFDRQLANPPPALPLQLLSVATQMALGSSAHWLADVDVNASAVARSAEWRDLCDLYELGAARHLLSETFPLLPRFIESEVNREILRRHGIVFDSAAYSLVTFTGGTPSAEAVSGWTHTVAQRSAAITLIECTLRKGEGITTTGRTAEHLGLYRTGTPVAYDATVEASAPSARQVLDVVRSLDLQDRYVSALNRFWTDARQDILFTLRGSYLFSAWQQYGSGALSYPGLRMVLAAAAPPGPADAPWAPVRAGWLDVNGVDSCILQLESDTVERIVLYFPGDQNRFYEFPTRLDMTGWLQRITSDQAGRAWLEAAFDLRDLQDGVVYTGVNGILQGPDRAQRMGQPVTALTDPDLFSALLTRMQTRTVRDAEVFMTSGWEVARRQWLSRMQMFNLVTGIASVFIPPLWPVVAAGSATELGLASDAAINGDSTGERRSGGLEAVGAAVGLGFSLPLAGSRLTRVADGTGARMLPRTQVAVAEAAQDPLRRLADRYARQVIVHGARASDDGVLRFAGRDYIQQAGRTYEVAFDRSLRTWRLQHPSGPLGYHEPVRLNAQGAWEPNPDIGLRGGMRGGEELAESARVEAQYRGAMSAHLARLRSHADDMATADFRWGREHWRRVPITHEPLAINGLKRLFISADVDAVQKGALSVIIERLEAGQRTEWFARLGSDVAFLTEQAGGRFSPVSQATMQSGNPIGGNGLCTGLSRLMALAWAENAQEQLVRNLRLALAEPASATAATVREVTRDAQGLALAPGVLSPGDGIEVSDMAGFLQGLERSTQFILSGSTHSMACAVTVRASGRRAYLLYDPNFGVAEFDSAVAFGHWVQDFFGLRPPHLLPGLRGGRNEALGELYGANPLLPAGDGTQFQLREVNAGGLMEQARLRGWDPLLRRPGPPATAGGGASG